MLLQVGMGERQAGTLVAALLILSLLTPSLPPLHALPTTIIEIDYPVKRSFELQCKGVYDKAIFARLDRICDDCYNLFREPQLHSLCRKDCFTTEYFKGCLDVLLLQDELDNIKKWIKQLHGAEPDLGRSFIEDCPISQMLRRNQP